MWVHSRSKLIKLLTELNEQNSDNPNLLLLAFSPTTLPDFNWPFAYSLYFIFLELSSASDALLFLTLEHEGVDLIFEEFCTDLLAP